jgi:cell division initiation protein
MPKKKKLKEGSPAAAPGTKRVTPVDIQQKEFRLSMRGYREADVDRFLDEVTEEVARLNAENKRLREEAELNRTVPLDTGGSVEAEALLVQAREEAERVLAEATSRARLIEERAARTAGGPRIEAPALSSPLSPFLAREREFLQSLVALIQAHATSVKEEIERAKERAQAESSEETNEVDAHEAAPAPPEDLVVIHKSRGEDSPDEGHEGVPAGIGARQADSQEFSPPESDLDDKGEDRSLRELFWGQD